MGVSMQKVKAGKMPGAPPGRTSFAHSVEVAKAHIAAFEKGRKGENYILAGTDASFAEVFSTIEEVVGVPHKVKPLPGILLRIFGEVAQLASTVTKKAPFVTPELVQWLCGKFSYDSGKAVKELGYQPRPLKEMLQDLWKSL
jgi:nucleoside-diphosphate-sugar epimerase